MFSRNSSTMKEILLILLLNLIVVLGVVVKTPLGKVEGFTAQTINGREIFSFEGVPYAEPPVGEHRFEEPAPKQPWEYTWVANISYRCMQYDQLTEPGHDFVIGDEDCLYLNVHTPTLNENANLDVVVFIHGGAFMFNHGDLGPDYLLDKDVVYVKPSYRLGPLGFLSTEDAVVPGNNGIKDQNMALEWIQKNIKSFGGNPNSVTLFGLSAGGASTHLHYFNKKSKGLFHQGWSQSGCALNPWVLMEEPLEKTKKIASLLGCPIKDTSKIIQCLKKRSARQIVNTVKDFQPWLYNPFSPFGVVIDKWAKDPVLPDHPYRLLKTKQFTDVPWTVSFTGSEGLYPAEVFYTEEYLNDIETRWNELMPFVLDYNYTVDQKLRDSVSQKIRKFYFGDKAVSKSTFTELVTLLGDRMFYTGLGKAATLQAQAASSPVYSYKFTYRGTHSYSEYGTCGTENFGAAHGDDTLYMLKIHPNMLESKDDKLISQVLLEILTSYAKDSKPKITGIEWTPVPKEINQPLVYVEIVSPENVKVETTENLGNLEFWKSLPIQENEKLFTASKDEL